MSAALDSVAAKWTTTVSAVTLGAAGILTAARTVELGFRGIGAAAMGMLRGAITDDRGRMRALGGQATDSFYQGALGATQRGAASLSAALSRGFSAASGAVGGFGRVLGALTGQSGAMGMLMGGPVGIAHAMHAVMAGAVEAGGEVEQLQLAFTTLLHSSDAARAHLDELQQFAVGKPFEFAFLATASRQLQTFGYSTQETMGLLRDVGDVAAGAGTGERGFRTFTRIFGQIRTMGRMTRGQISQLGAAGLDVQRLRTNLGMTEAEFANIARAGIPAERLVSALRQSMSEQWGGGMDRASMTLGAKLSDLGDVIGNLRRKLYETLGPTLIPVLDAVSGFLSRNVTQIGAVVGLLLTTTIRLVQAVLMPLYGALSDVMGRALTDTRSSVGGILGTMQRAALVLEGVSALIVGDNGRGVTGISVALRDRLVRAGLWHAALEIARFANRARALIGGFVEGFVGRIGRSLGTLSRLASFFGVAGLGMMRTRADAQRLGARLAALVGIFLSVRTALGFVGPAMRLFTYLPTIIGGVTRAVQFLRVAMWAFAANPVTLAIGLAVVALGALALYLARNVSVMGFLRRAWASVAAVFAPVGVLLGRMWETVKGLGVALLDGVMVALYAVANAARPLLGVLRLVGSFLAVGLYVYLMLVGGALYGLARIAGYVAGVVVGGFVLALRMLAVTAGWLAEALLPSLTAAFRWVQMALATVGAYLGNVGLVLRAFGAIAWIVLRVMFGAAVAFVVDGVRSMAAAMQPALTAIRKAFVRVFGFLRPYLEPIFYGLRDLASSVFGTLAEIVLAPFRLMARGLVAIFNALPARLRPAELAGSVATLTDFANGGGIGGAAPSPYEDPNAGARQSINASRAAPARAANAATTAANAATAAASVSAPVVYQPPPTHVMLHVDGQVLARAVANANDDDAVRQGDTRGTGTRRPRG